MTSWILTVSYLWKDTWKRWLEQPGSVLARSVVTTIMVSLSVLLLVGFRMQIDKIRDQVEAFGLDNLLIVETVTPQDIAQGHASDRFRSIRKWGNLFTARVMLASATGSNGRNASVVAYEDSDMIGLMPYLRYGHDVFVLSADMPAGLVVDYTLEQRSFSGVALTPDERVSQLLQGDTLFVPSSYVTELQKLGYSMIYYLERDKAAPEIPRLSEAVRHVVRADGKGKVDIKSAEMLKQRLNQLEQQQGAMRIWLAVILGGALALIYGVLSILEFRQSMYISALLRSFGVSSVLLGLRTIGENVIIVNTVTFGIIYLLSRYHETIFSALKVTGNSNIAELYWGQESMWIIVAANAGILMSCIPVFWALRKPVGSILE